MLKFTKNPVNKFLSIIFWIVGWLISYSVVYYSGYNVGSNDAVITMHYHCFQGNNVMFEGDINNYLCMKSTKM